MSKKISPQTKKMNDAELYHNNNSLQKRDAFNCLEEYAKKIKWKRIGDRVIDIGCGDGSVTVKLLKKYIPASFEKLVGCDISEKMIEFANKYHKDDKTTFSVLNIEGQLPDNMRCTFDHAFSFYTLHWIEDQETAFTNIYNLLTEGGECLLTFLGYHKVFHVYRALAQSNKWSTWLGDVERFISPYQDSQKPENEVRKLMDKAGFTKIDVKCHEKSFVYDSPEILKKAVRAVNPFGMPDEVFDEFMLDYMDVLRDMKLIDEENNNKPITVRSYYKLIVVYGTK